jgi:hypothetical protein
MGHFSGGGSLGRFNVGSSACRSCGESCCAIELKGTPAEYKAGLDRAIAYGWLWLHETGRT